MAKRRIPQVLLLIETSRAYGRGLAEGIARYAEEHGPWSIQFDERSLTDPFPRWLAGWRGDGIIARSTHRRDVARLLATRLPIVELYAYHDSTFPSVRPDEAAIASLAVEHLLDCGVKNFAFFDAARAHWTEARRRAFEQALRRVGCRCCAFSLPSAAQPAGNGRREVGDRGLARWLAKLPKPCGVFCACDFFAMHLLRTCRACSIAVPEQIAVLGVDNDPVLCGVCLPRLSSIDLGSDRIGYRAAALLARLMVGRPCSKTSVSVEPQRVVARQSTDVLAIDDADVARATKLIREHACRQLRVAEVAASVGLSRRTLEQRFQDALHHTVKDEIVRVRMERARTLLATTDTAIAIVAKLSGFASPKYFSRAFRLRTGMTPHTYRNQRRLPLGSSLPRE
jgi:LacI family transcriptional regulator